MASASAFRCDGVWSSPIYPGVTGTPASTISFLAASFSPMARIEAGGAPIQMIPAATTASANPAFSDRKP
jgi:hypothetical protein